ncbi:AAA family ATPase [Achromobacter mucicolens]|uniref:AAA family ATPase n=1 Tax=Achromobacter mucicolens TaxID=1389922 RepID=UPI0022F3AEA0|nr:AAA family ATPase [Achromobacter mucicolens]WBX87842.1 AAA family ATPase [Achromobacter mucicolens]
MNRIFSSSSDFGEIELAIPGDTSSRKNIFTVLVGKNGVGKSRLLSNIAKSRIYEIAEEIDPPWEKFNDFFPKLIAVSTSPFDKFPPNKRSVQSQKTDTNYRYVGIRGEGPYGASSAVSLLSSAAKGWLEKLARSDNTANLLPVFQSLSFQPHAEFIFKPGYIGNSQNSNSESYHNFGMSNEMRSLNSRHGINIDERYISHLYGYGENHRHEIYEAMIELNHFESSRKAVTLTVDFISGKFHLGSQYTNSDLAKALLILLSAGFLRLIDIRLHKENYGPMSLKRASSGEQCLLMMMFGIAGHITNDSIILIDEPEISLHPHWQEEFIIMLTNTFSSYSGCQFIIATHSPQIVARLPSEGCYVSSLTNKTLYKAKDFNKRSADYQLAELFGAPGIMNEYIARLAFSLLSKVKATRKVNNENSAELRRLINLSDYIDESDPTKELIYSVIEVCKKYADN